MVSRLLKFFNRASPGINEAALLLGIFTLVSQVLGLIRDRLLATYVGPGLHLDVYYAAFKIPDFLYVSVATLAAITVLLPYLSQKYADGDEAGHDRAKAFIDQVFTVLIIFLTGLSLILFIIMPWLAQWIAPGFDAASLETLTMLSRIMLAQPIIIGVSNMLSSITQMFRKFFITALAPVFYNLGIIIGVVVLYPLFGIVGLAYGVILGAVFHLLIQVPVLVAHRFVPRITANISWTEMRSLVLTSVPRTFGLSLSSLSALVLTAIASTLGVGSIAIFNLSNNMLNVPVGVIGISYATASFPMLIQLFHNHEQSRFIEHLFQALRKIIFWSLPVSVLFIVLRAQIVRVVLGSQSFSWNDTRLAAACLALFVVGLVAQNMIHVLVRGYYAMGNTKTPLITNAVSQGLVVVLAFGLLALFRTHDGFANAIVNVLRLDGVLHVQILMLPLAFAIGNILNSIALWTFMVRMFPESDSFPVARTFLQTLTASLAMGAVSYGALNILALVVNQDTFGGIFVQGLLAGFIGLTIFVTVMIMLKNRDLMDLITALRRKFWKAEVVVESETAS